jgi:hypothetical protein
MIAASLFLLAAFGLAIATSNGLYVTVPAACILVAPLYAGLFWLIFERQAGKDDAEEATRVSRAAYRKARAIEEHIDGVEPPATGRHHSWSA